MVLRPAVAALFLLVSSGVEADPALDRAKEVLAKSILFDGHNDLPWTIRQYKEAPGDVDRYDLRTKAPDDGQTDIPRLRAGGVGAVFWSVYTPGEAAGGFAKTHTRPRSMCSR